MEHCVGGPIYNVHPIYAGPDAGVRNAGKQRARGRTGVAAQAWPLDAMLGSGTSGSQRPPRCSERKRSAAA